MWETLWKVIWPRWTARLSKTSAGMYLRARSTPLALASLECAVVFACGFHFALHADHALARGVDGEFAEIGGDPLAAQLFCDGCGCAGAAEEVGYEVAFVAGRFDNAFEQGFGLLRGIMPRLVSLFGCRTLYHRNFPYIRHIGSLRYIACLNFPDSALFGDFSCKFGITKCFQSRSRFCFIQLIPRSGCALCIPVNCVVHFLEISLRGRPPSISPNYLVPKIPRPKNLVQHQPHIPTHPPIAMHINAPILGEQIAHQNQPLVNHRNEGIRPLPPGVPIGDLFQYVGLFGEAVAANFNVHGEIRAHIEGRVNVNELQAAGVFNVLAQRALRGSSTCSMV